ncbi:hypothetical protein AGMMS49992_25680 [Clostridia bacterium]|nr:hypothetical protein AGMMS49992_25680 [Clostridia bacterium]
MPELCRFDGITIHMYSEPTTPHKLPHLHAYYQDMQAIVSLDGFLLSGDLPSRKLAALQVWIEKRKEELMEDWELLLIGKPFKKISPLK